MFLDLCSEIAADANLAGTIRTIYNGIRIAVPVILIIVGMVEMGRAIASQKEDEIKKAQSALIKKAVAAVLVFLMFSIVKILVGVVGANEKEKGCLDTILNGAGSTENTNNSGTNSGATHSCVDGTYWNGAECVPEYKG